MFEQRIHFMISKYILGVKKIKVFFIIRNNKPYRCVVIFLKRIIGRIIRNKLGRVSIWMCGEEGGDDRGEGEA